MNNKDLILKTIVSNPNINGRTFFTADSLKTIILKNKNLDEIEFLLKQIVTERIELLEVKKVNGYRFSVFPTGLIESFLKNGGFTKIEEDKIEKTNKDNKIKETEFKLAKSNIKANELNEKNSKFNKWTTIFNIIIGLLNIGLLIWQILKAK